MHLPTKKRQVERLTPQFEALQDALERKNLALQRDAMATAPEHVIVFETSGPVSEFIDAVRATSGLDWLVEEQIDEREPDDDFYVHNDRTKLISARLYMILANQVALQQLLSLWDRWKNNKKLPTEFKNWTSIFRCLRAVRKWGVEDRLAETNILEDWEARKGYNEEYLPVEIEFWFRQEDQRTSAQERLEALVKEDGGRVLATSMLSDISYHAMLAEIPISAVERIFKDRSVSILHADDVHLLKPVPQHFTGVITESVVEESSIDRNNIDNLEEPVVALLDGLPIENHELLRGRLTVDDPDGWGAEYPSSQRSHGTAMASLILHGDLNSGERSSHRRLYVRPILRPDAQGKEAAPYDTLWVDLIHRAVRRIVEGDGDSGPVAPSIKVINLSVGNLYQPFLRSQSALARLIDWLAWKYKVLFIVSAGNDESDIELSEGDIADLEAEVIRSLASNQRHRRILSPAEAINALTVGGVHLDYVSKWKPRYPEDKDFFQTAGMPAPYSRVGRGYLKAVKPEVFAPGGRMIYSKKLAQQNRNIFVRNKQHKIGLKHAAPGVGEGGDTKAISFTSGTSNAAAITSRWAEKAFDVVKMALTHSSAEYLRHVPDSLFIKALLVHAAGWSAAAQELFEGTLRTDRNRSHLRDLLSAFLGYGVINPDRFHSCTDVRASALGGGFICKNFDLI